MNLADAAIDYACAGWPVFRILPDKKQPYDKWVYGPGIATTDRYETAKRWYEMPIANIGIATGHQARADAYFLTVLDIDQDEPTCVGRPAWAVPTYEVSTPSGGLHLYYYTEQPVKSRRIAPGIDVKSAGGMVVAAPSVTARGMYHWLEQVCPARISAELFRPIPSLGLKAQAPKASALPSLRFERQTEVGQGNRDNYLTAYAGWCIANNDLELLLDPEYALAIALAEESLRVCRPPLPERDLWRIAKSIWRKHEKELLDGLV